MSGKEPWLVASYEIDMHEHLSKVSVSERLIQNAITESRVLHARQLCEIFIPAGDSRNDDICLGHLVPGWDIESSVKYGRLRDLVQDLKRKYGYSRKPNSPCWVFNKKMAHATLERTDDYDYGPALPNRRFTIDGRLVGDIGEIIAALEYDVILDDVTKPDHDGRTTNGRRVQIKATFKEQLTFKTVPNYYLGFKLSTDGSYDEIYNGPGRIICDRYAHRKDIGVKLL